MSTRRLSACLTLSRKVQCQGPVPGPSTGREKRTPKAPPARPCSGLDKQQQWQVGGKKASRDLRESRADRLRPSQRQISEPAFLSLPVRLSSRYRLRRVQGLSVSSPRHAMRGSPDLFEPCWCSQCDAWDRNVMWDVPGCCCAGSIQPTDGAHSSASKHRKRSVLPSNRAIVAGAVAPGDSSGPHGERECAL